jgi:hypothetical protein
VKRTCNDEMLFDQSSFPCYVLEEDFLCRSISKTEMRPLARRAKRGQYVDFAGPAAKSVNVRKNAEGGAAEIKRITI